MDFIPIFTALNFALAAILAISEIRKRRSESKSLDAGSDTKIMTEIKQASVDLFKELKAENKELREKLEKSEAAYDEQEIKITSILSENRQITSKLNAVQSEVTSLKESLIDRDKERAEWEKGISILLNQLVKAKIVPLWLPDGVTISEIEVEPKLVISGFGQK